jgi:hypothetical protein
LLQTKHFSLTKKVKLTKWQKLFNFAANSPLKLYFHVQKLSEKMLAILPIFSPALLALAKFKRSFMCGTTQGRQRK